MTTKQKEAKNTNLNIRISVRLVKKIARAARKAGITASAWIRKGLDELADRELGK